MTDLKDKDKAIRYMRSWREDWNKFVYEVLHARLDKEQRDIIDSVQHNPMTSVASGTARGKDYTSACACLCFFYLTPRFDKTGKMVSNTKVAMTAPSYRQVHNIMTPEVRRQFKSAGFLPGRLVGDDIRTDYEEWFLTGFKAGDDNTEAWSGFHASNTMFAVTEASGISETIFNAIEGNLQGNSRLLIVFNPNVTTGYAARAMQSERFAKFRLNSLNAENVVQKQNIYPGQVDYRWVADKVQTWAHPILETDFDEGEGDFHWEGGLYRPNDLFRVKVLGLFPKVSEDVLIPYEWISLANERWLKLKEQYGQDYYPKNEQMLLGVDVAGMGRDSSVLVPRYGNFVKEFKTHQSAGHADHMHIVGMVMNELHNCPSSKPQVFIDTIGEGAGVYSRLEELNVKGVHSSKNSESAKGLTDSTGQITFANMRAFLHWSLREWLNPKNGFEPALPPNDMFSEEATNIHWKFTSTGSIIIEPKEDIKERIGRSPDVFDGVANTFYPYDKDDESELSDEEIARMFS